MFVYCFYAASIYSPYPWNLIIKLCITLFKLPTNGHKALAGSPYAKRNKREIHNKCSPLVKFSKIRNKEAVYLQTAAAGRKGKTLIPIQFDELLVTL